MPDQQAARVEPMQDDLQSGPIAEVAAPAEDRVGELLERKRFGRGAQRVHGARGSASHARSRR